MRWKQKLLCLYQKSHLNPLFSSSFSELQERMKVRIGSSIPPQICLTTSKGTAKAQLDKACCGLVSVNLNVVTSYFANKNQYNFKMQTHVSLPWIVVILPCKWKLTRQWNLHFFVFSRRCCYCWPKLRKLWKSCSEHRYIYISFTFAGKYNKIILRKEKKL